MCGIIACVSSDNCANILFEGLIQLKNRGYDSAGIATLNTENTIVVNKYASNNKIDAYDELFKTLDNHCFMFIIFVLKV